MKSPETPPDEQRRLDTLRLLGILDTASEERFDRLTRLAKRLFGVPIALVSLVDENRQWFKSSIGLSVPETPRTTSFCGHAILGLDVMVVPDARQDDRFHDNPLVTGDPNIRFYAGCPLSVQNGSKLGTLCLIDDKPRQLSRDDLDLLQDLARMAEQELAAVQLATMDDLSMLSNRRGFESLALHALSVCVRFERPASLLFFDLDDFKQVNDTCGHAAGDRALVDFADALRTAFRNSDVIGRIGGDEFAALLIGSTPACTAHAIERLQTLVRARNSRAAADHPLRFSVGVANSEPGQPTNITDLLAAADKAMYEQKRARKLALEG